MQLLFTELVTWHSDGIVVNLHYILMFFADFTACFVVGV
jgi:hypothetical protein